LLRVLDTGVSEHSVVQGAADRLMLAAIDRAASLLGEAGVCSDADVQASLLELLGPLEAELNDSQLRRRLFSKPSAAAGGCRAIRRGRPLRRGG